MKRRDFINSVAAAITISSNSRILSAAQKNRRDDKRKTENPRQSEAGDAPAGRVSWRFDRWADRKGWIVPPRFIGAVMGGGVWLRLGPANCDPGKIDQPRFQIGGDRAFNIHDAPLLVDSPKGLNIPSTQVNQVRLRIINLSPETDGYVYWRTSENPEKDVGPVRFTMAPNHKEWQEVICHVGNQWSGTLDQIRLALALTAVRGDMWIGRIEIAEGAPPTQRPRPDVCSGRVVPKLVLPGIAQDDFLDAFKVLDDCLITNVPVFGFNFPVMGPGGGYGENWWQLDSSLAVTGAKWANQDFAENVIRGFTGVQAQNPDGRIDLYGGSAIRGQIGDNSSLPRFFEAAYDVARRTDDQSLRLQIYLTMRKYLDWWLSPVKRDPTTGLITAVFEETFSDTYDTPQNPALEPQTLAAVDLNVAVAVGCYRASALATYLGRNQDAAQNLAEFDDLKQSINRYLWNENDGAYYNYDVRRRAQRRRLICTTFDTLRLGIAPAQRAKKLVSLLLNPRLFNWGKLPVTSIAMTEPDFTQGTGTYNGTQWFGDVWAMRNAFIVSALEDAGRHDLAAELAWATVKAFNGNYREYLIPSTGKGGGVLRYAWSASLYIACIIEHIFGIDYDHILSRLRIAPRIPTQLTAQTVSLEDVILGAREGTHLSLTVNQTAEAKAQITVQLNGTLPKGEMQVLLPVTPTKPLQVRDVQGRRLPVIRNPEGLQNMAGVRIPMAASTHLRFG